MNLQQALYNILKANSGYTAHVAGRIFSGVVKQDVGNWPCSVIRPEGTRRRIRTLQGDVALMQERIAVISGGKTFASAAETDLAAQLALDEFSGTVVTTVASPQESLTLQAIYMDFPSHEYIWDDRTQIHNFRTDFICNYLDPALID